MRGGKKVPVPVWWALLALAIGIGALGWWHISKDSPEFDPNDPAYNKTYWTQEIARRGPIEAYAEFLKKVDGGSYSWTHFSAHAMGEILFDAEGMDGIRICDGSFDYGCYHGFSSRAIAADGKDALLKINDICNKLGDVVSACKHGLGHGVLEYTGPVRLNEALEMCKTLIPQDARLSECLNGVFMQYLTPSEEILDAAALSPRTLDSAHPYEPCTEVGEEFRSFCYFELGQWFRRTKGTDYGALCGALQGEAARSCFLGVGTDLVRGWKDADTLIAKCARYAPDNELSCRAGAAWAFVYNGGHTRLCAYEDRTLKARCEEEADFTDGLDPSIRLLFQ